MLILPAIDIRGGKCVRLTQGDYSQEKIYAADPAQVAAEFEADGASWVHVVDLDGAKEGAPKNLEAIREIAQAVNIPIEVGGGVRSMQSAETLFELGAARIIVGTKLVQDPDFAEELFRAFGDRVVAGIDCRGGRAAVAGWLDQSEVSGTDLAIRMEELGAKRIILTDIAQDGMLTGPNLSLLKEVSDAVSLPIIQSGGIGSLEHVRQLLESDAVPEGVIIGRAIYERLVSVKDAVALAASFSVC